MKHYLYLAVGLLIGGAGAVLFTKSLPPAAGSQEERILLLERETKQAQVRIKELEALPSVKERPRPGMSDRMRQMLADLRAGRPVDVEDVYQSMKGHMRDLAPLFGIFQKQAELKEANRISGEWGRKYDLNPEQQRQLKSKLAELVETNRRTISEKMWDENTRLAEMTKLTHESRPDAGIDPLMEEFLTGEKLSAFRVERLTERAKRVQNEADRRLNRLNSIVQLDDAQQDQVFSLMARSSRHYDPAMQLEGLGADAKTVPAGDEREKAIQSLLRPDQRAQYEAEMTRQRTEAEKDLNDMGLKLPADWNPWEWE